MSHSSFFTKFLRNINTYEIKKYPNNSENLYRTLELYELFYDSRKSNSGHINYYYKIMTNLNYVNITEVCCITV